MCQRNSTPTEANDTHTKEENCIRIRGNHIGVEKDKKTIKKPRKQDRHMIRDRELNVEKFKTTQRKKDNWKRRKKYEQGSTIELLALNGLQRESCRADPVRGG